MCLIISVPLSHNAKSIITVGSSDFSSVTLSWNTVEKKQIFTHVNNTINFAMVNYMYEM